MQKAAKVAQLGRYSIQFLSAESGSVSLPLCLHILFKVHFQAEVKITKTHFRSIQRHLARRKDTAKREGRRERLKEMHTRSKRLRRTRIDRKK